MQSLKDKIDYLIEVWPNRPDILRYELLKTFSAELDKLINKHKAINSELHGREDCKSCSLLEDLEQARKELGK